MIYRPIYKPRTRAKEYCDLAVSIYTGCPHRCTYCYAPRTLRRDREKFHTDVRPRPGIVQGVITQLKSMRGHGKKIMLCFTCDPYPIEHDSMATREVIRAIKESGNHVQILTKGDETAQRDLDLLDKGDSFGVTISGAGFSYEPNAAIELVRLENLMRAKERKISTWVSCEPVYNPSIVLKLIEAGDYIDMFRVGKLNYHDSDINWNEFGHDVEERCKLECRSYYIKEDLRAEMET